MEQNKSQIIPSEVTKKTKISLEIVITAIVFSVSLAGMYFTQSGRIDKLQMEIQQNLNTINQFKYRMDSIDDKLDLIITKITIKETENNYEKREHWDAGCMSDYEINLVHRLKEAGVNIPYTSIRDIQYNNGVGCAVETTVDIIDD